MKLLQGDCIELMKDIQDGSVDLVVTSPPYDNLRTYNGKCEWNEAVWEKAFVEIFRLLKNGGVCVWIVNDSTIDGSETGTSFRQALYAKECGFLLHDTMIWYKQSYQYPDPKRYCNTFEYMFIFSKGIPKTINLIKDKINTSAGKPIHSCERQKDGTLKIKSGAMQGRLIKEYSVRHNVWNIAPCFSSLERTGHPAQYPVRLAQDHIVTWSNPCDTVLDPFSGSGTTGVACVNTGREFIGMELDPNYYTMAKERIERAIEANNANN